MKHISWESPKKNLWLGTVALRKKPPGAQSAHLVVARLELKPATSRRRAYWHYEAGGKGLILTDTLKGDFLLEEVMVTVERDVRRWWRLQPLQQPSRKAAQKPAQKPAQKAVQA